jgi:hypothetical protein
MDIVGHEDVRKLSSLVSLSANGRAARKVNTKINKLAKNNVILAIFLIVCVQANVLNCDNRPHGGYPYPSGSGWNVSEEIKSDLFYFFSVNESTKKNILKRE